MALLQFSPIRLKVAFEIEHNNKHYPDLIRSKKQLIKISKFQLPKEKQWLPQVSPYILQPQCKKPSKPLIFLKPHKCGSSLLKNILAKYIRQPGNTDLQNRHVFLGPFIGGYPGKFMAKFAGKPHSRNSIINHMRWNKENDLLEYKKAFNISKPEKISSKEAFYKVAIIRHPLAQFISAFDFFYKQRGLNKFNATFSCYLEPFRQFTNLYNNEKSSKEPFRKNNLDNDDRFNIKEYLTTLKTKGPNFQDKTIQLYQNSFGGFRGLNFISNEFGLDWRNGNSEEEIGELVDQFDLIVVLERLPESLIFLKNLLCMDFENILLSVPIGVLGGFSLTKIYLSNLHIFRNSHLLRTYIF